MWLFNKGISLFICCDLYVLRLFSCISWILIEIAGFGLCIYGVDQWDIFICYVYVRGIYWVCANVRPIIVLGIYGSFRFMFNYGNVGVIDVGVIMVQWICGSLSYIFITFHDRMIIRCVYIISYFNSSWNRIDKSDGFQFIMFYYGSFDMF